MLVFQIKKSLLKHNIKTYFQKLAHINKCIYKALFTDKNHKVLFKTVGKNKAIENYIYINNI